MEILEFDKRLSNICELYLKYHLNPTDHKHKKLVTAKQNLFGYASNQVEAVVSDDCERFTLEEILQLIREEITESFSDCLDEETLKDKIYTIHGFVICSLSRKKASKSR